MALDGGQEGHFPPHVHAFWLVDGVHASVSKLGEHVVANRWGIDKSGVGAAFTVMNDVQHHGSLVLVADTDHVVSDEIRGAFQRQCSEKYEQEKA